MGKPAGDRRPEVSSDKCTKEGRPKIEGYVTFSLKGFFGV
jgi:hypothetical protein